MASYFLMRAARRAHRPWFDARSHREPRMTGLRQGPTVQHDSKAGTLRLSGLFATLQDPTLVNKAFDAFGWHKDTNVYADNFEMKVKYW